MCVCHLAVQAFNQKFNKNSRASVSTDAQGDWWGSEGSGTMAHSSIASFFGDTAETTLQFARNLPADIKRIALVDFHNDCVGETIKIMKVLWNRYWDLHIAENRDEAEKYRLFGVRLDTSGNMRDISIPSLDDKKQYCGVNPRLVTILRGAIDKAWKDWELDFQAQEAAKKWCKDIRIVVTGGFNAKKIDEFESLGVPVDIYGVGSSLLENSKETGTTNDFTADIVRVSLGNEWHRLSKVGRGPCDNPKLERIR